MASSDYETSAPSAPAMTLWDHYFCSLLRGGMSVQASAQLADQALAIRKARQLDDDGEPTLAAPAQAPYGASYYPQQVQVVAPQNVRTHTVPGAPRNAAQPAAMAGSANGPPPGTIESIIRKPDGTQEIIRQDSRGNRVG